MQSRVENLGLKENSARFLFRHCARALVLDAVSILTASLTASSPLSSSPPLSYFPFISRTHKRANLARYTPAGLVASLAKSDVPDLVV